MFPAFVTVWLSPGAHLDTRISQTTAESFISQSLCHLVPPPDSIGFESAQSTCNQRRVSRVSNAKFGTCNRADTLLHGCVEAGVLRVSGQNIQIIESGMSAMRTLSWDTVLKQVDSDSASVW